MPLLEELRVTLVFLPCHLPLLHLFYFVTGFLLATVQRHDSLSPSSSLHPPQPMSQSTGPHRWDSTKGSCLCLAHPHGVTPGVVGCSTVLVNPLAKAMLGLALMLHAMKSKEKRRLGPWRTALTPNLSQLPLTSPTVPCLAELCSQQDLNPLGCPRGGNRFSCFPDKETKAQRGREPAQGPQVSQLRAREQRFPTLIVLNTLLWAPLSLALH